VAINNKGSGASMATEAAVAIGQERDRREDGAGANVPEAAVAAVAPASLLGMLPGSSPRSRAGEKALVAVARGILERARETPRLRVETIPALWPMTRHLVRRLTDALVERGMLDRSASGAVSITAAGSQLLASE
jgi:hypothetical protein